MHAAFNIWVLQCSTYHCRMHGYLYVDCSCTCVALKVLLTPKHSPGSMIRTVKLKNLSVLQSSSLIFTNTIQLYQCVRKWSHFENIPPETIELTTSWVYEIDSTGWMSLLQDYSSRPEAVWYRNRSWQRIQSLGQALWYLVKHSTT